MYMYMRRICFSKVVLANNGESKTLKQHIMICSFVHFEVNLYYFVSLSLFIFIPLSFSPTFIHSSSSSDVNFLSGQLFAEFV